MTHSLAIALLLAPDAAPEARGGLVAHLARCPDCWTVLASLDAAEPEDERAMAACFDCEPVRDVLFALVDLDAGTIAREHAGAARHLAWCLGCRTRFAEIADVERELGAAPRWIELGGRVREAVGRLVVRMGRAAAGLVEIPDAFVPAPAAAAVPVRGAETAPALVRGARVELGDGGVWAELEVDDAEAAGFALRVVGAGDDRLSVRVREARADGERLLARYTLRGAEPIVVRGLWPGSFVLELHDARDAVHRVRLDVHA